MRLPEWLSDSEFKLGAFKFKCLLGDYHAVKTDEHQLVMLKNREVLTRQLDVYRGQDIKRAFEFGIFQGGSVVFLTECLELERMAALDFSQPLEALDAILARHGLTDRIRLTYGVSQSDRTRVDDVIRASFRPGDLDLIIDDASHLYEHTKASFEIAFPYLRPGGLYVIEDWGWAHWPGYWQSPEARWRDRPAMSNFIFELTMAVATSPRIFAELTILPGAAVVKKANTAPVGGVFEFDKTYALRGKALTHI
ncbi:MAG TPA: class I SAM-dependent methyltransferase [Caulobacterales bacterium]|nr:class I SAM-dependent methyltransferase [Vitreimonas sp.]HVY85335.1 class I SAM-dependent methyltransferase [Caulobacterales bacterium]